MECIELIYKLYYCKYLTEYIFRDQMHTVETLFDIRYSINSMFYAGLISNKYC